MTTAREPNVIWAGEGEPPSFIMDGREPVILPERSVARRGFWSPEPLRLVRLSGGGFKLYVAKGDDAVKAGASRARTKTKRS